MRYFKYKGSQTTEKETQKALLAELTKEEKRLIRKDKLLGTLGSIVFFTVFLGGFACCVWGLKQIPFPERLFEVIMRHIANFILGAVGFVLCLIIGALVSMPICSKNIGQRLIHQKYLAKACEHLREFYGLQEPCIVTKCYDASDKKFKNHDVCILSSVTNCASRPTSNTVFFMRKGIWGATLFCATRSRLTRSRAKNF